MDSLLNQTFKNIEIILVNDGSKDNSGLLCDEYAKIDKRVKVIHQDNRGLSSARNSGMKIAEGVYISFVDAGDVVELCLYESLVGYCNKGIDVVEFPYYVQNALGERFPAINKVEKNCILSRVFIDEEWLPCLLNIKENKNDLPLCFVWRILFKKEIIKKYNISFDEQTRKWEDRDFIILYVMHCNTVVFYNEPLYAYVCLNNGQSLSSYYYSDLVFERIRKMKEREKIFARKYDFNTDYYCNTCLRVFTERLQELVLREEPQNAKNYILQVFNDELVCSIAKRAKNISDDLKYYRDWIIAKDVEATYMQLQKCENRCHNTGSLHRIKFVIKKIFSRRMLWHH